MRLGARKTLLSWILLVVLLAATVLCGVSCGEDETETESGAATVKTITVIVTDNEGVNTTFTYTTDAEMLGDVLVEEGLISGEQGPYGLMVDTVNGLRADYNLDGAYWSFCKGGEYLMTGVDTTPIADGEQFEIVWTKA
jgi:hypothetical protein